MNRKTHGRVAFITTPEYRDKRASDIDSWVYRHMYQLCNHFDVISTARTFGYVATVINRPLEEVDTHAISEGCGFSIESQEDLVRWRRTIEGGLTSVGASIKGMIEVTFELVEGRLDGVFHFTDWVDVAGKPDSMVLRREANVHNILIASDVHTARAALASWMSRLAQSPNKPLFEPRPPKDRPLVGIPEGARVLALIAHDGMKLELCRFVVENVRRIFEDHDFILATGTTGGWVKRFAVAAGRSPKEVEEKVRPCRSGPHGGDVQIAAAVIRKLCRKVVFLQDPFAAHAHATDIHLFEQAVLLFERAAVAHDIEVELATNSEAAKVIIGAI